MLKLLLAVVLSLMFCAPAFSLPCQEDSLPSEGVLRESEWPKMINVHKIHGVIPERDCAAPCGEDKITQSLRPGMEVTSIRPLTKSEKIFLKSLIPPKVRERIAKNAVGYAWRVPKYLTGRTLHLSARAVGGVLKGSGKVLVFPFALWYNSLDFTEDWFFQT